MIKFGTSGFRGIMNETFTQNNVLKIAYALSEIINLDKKKKVNVVVGFDNRLMSEEMALFVSEFLSSRGIDVTLFTKSVPSPLITYMTQYHTLGIMITASHNPSNYNGIKLFSYPGKEADDNFTKKIEEIANKIDIKEIKNPHNIKAGQITKTEDIKQYCESILQFTNKTNIKNSGLKVLFNAMNGSSTECVQKIANTLRIDYEIMNGQADPCFGGKIPAPYKHNLIEQSKLVKEKFDLGIAFDGDGDRISAIDKYGNFYDCNYLLPIIYKHFLDKGYKGDAVKNTALSNLSKLIAERYGFKCHESKVGFKHIGALLEETSAFIGGESNGIAFKEHTLSKDGICAGFILIDILSCGNNNLKKLLQSLKSEYNFKSEVVEYAYPVTADQKRRITKKLFEDKKIPNTELKIKSISYLDGLKITYENNYWGVLRFSGNENVIRLFAEMPTKKECNKLITIYESFIGVKTRQI